MSVRRAQLVLAMLVAFVGLATAHASIRSPDAEVVYRTAEALALRHTFAVDEDLESWPEFGLPLGRDGRRYAVFGPLLSLIEAPVVRAVEALVPTEVDSAIVPLSHYYADGKNAAVWQQRYDPASARGHAVRAWVTLLDVACLVAIALVTFDLGLLLTGSCGVAWLAGLVFTLGTLLLPYSTCLFSEPIAVLLTLVGWKSLISVDPRLAGSESLTVEPRRLVRRLIVSGLAFGMAATAHISAVLALPFVALYAACPHLMTGGVRLRAGLQRLAPFALGAAVPLLALAYYNFVRFGDPLETGRSLQTDMGYGTFVLSTEGLVGLTTSWGKGLLWYCPLAPLALFATAAAFRVQPTLTVLAVGAFASRLLFIAMRSDWHGGFGLGPRYLLLGLPWLLLLPLLAARGRSTALLGESRQRAGLLAITAVAVVHQLYFASGEVFAYQHVAKATAQVMRLKGVALDLYFDFELSPLAGLLDLTSGPYLYRFLTGNTYASFALLSAAVTSAILLAGRSVLRASAS